MVIDGRNHYSPKWSPKAVLTPVQNYRKGGADETLDLDQVRRPSMYSYEDRMRAVELYIKHDLSVADTIRELGYLSDTMLVRWYEEYQTTGGLHERYIRQPAYTSAQMKAAVNYYLEHGRNLSRTVRAMGYPTRETLAGWIDDLAPGERKVRIRYGTMVQFSDEQKKEAVIELSTREGPAVAVAEKLGASRCSLYRWKKELLGEEAAKTMAGSSKPPLPDDRDALRAEVETLKRFLPRTAAATATGEYTP